MEPHLLVSVIGMIRVFDRIAATGSGTAERLASDIGASLWVGPQSRH